MAAQGIPIATHSNSFLTPPWDGTGPAARAVDAAAAAGVLWINSAGNFAERHWRGVAAARGRGDPDRARPRRPAAVQPGGGARPPSPRACRVQRQDATGAWVEVQHSTAASPINAVTGTLITDGGVLPGGGEPGLRRRPADLDLFSRTVGFGAMAVADGSIPTPGDAAGAVTVGAVRWTGTAIEPYSSNGPHRRRASRTSSARPT